MDKRIRETIDRMARHEARTAIALRRLKEAIDDGKSKAQGGANGQEGQGDHSAAEAANPGRKG